MLIRILLGASLCVAACAPVRAADAPAEVPGVIGLEISAVGDPAPPVGETGPEDAVAQPREPSPEAGASVVVDGQSSTAPWFDGPATLPVAVVGLDDWTAYTMIDALFLQRGNPGSATLAVTSEASADPGVPVITTADMQYPTFGGMRLFQGWRDADGAGFELGYLGVWGMFADELAVSPASELALPGELGLVAGSGFDAASAIRPVLNGTVNGFELNIFSTRVHDGARRDDPLPWRRAWSLFEGSTSTADWLLGIRWAGIAETASLNVTADRSEPTTTAYRVVTSSHLVGPQIGYRRRSQWDVWAIEGWSKVGLMGSILSQSQGPIVGPFDDVTIREPRSATLGGVGMIGDLGATVVRRFGDHWGLRAGYTLLWFSGVAPAAEQWDFTNTSTSGTGVNIGTVFLHGATLGVECSW